MKNFDKTLFLILFPFFIHAQCVLTTGSYTEAQVESCLTTCGCSRIEIPDGNVVTMDGDWNLTDQGDVDIVIFGTTGQLVFPGNGNNTSTLSLTASSTLTFEDSNNTAPIVSANSNNQPRLIVGTTTYTSGDFSNIISAGGISPIMLPVEFSSFEIRVSELGFPELNWLTASELNNKGFSILRNGQSIAFVPSKGNRQQQINYSWVDMEISSEYATYQLVQYNLDGSIGFQSHLVEYRKEANQFEVYPNPVEKDLYVVFPSSLNGGLDIQILGMNGQIMTKIKGGEQNKIDLSSFTNGAYLLQVLKNKQVVFSTKILKK